MSDREPKLVLVDDAVWVLTAPVGNGIYDFSFETAFPCRHPLWREDEVEAIARVGAEQDYTAFYEEQLGAGIRLVHSPAQHHRASELAGWYPHIVDLTARSACFPTIPEADVIEREFGWPVFVKGQRQTNRHRRSTSILRNRDELERAAEEWRKDPVLHWQEIVCREYVPLRLVEDVADDRIPSSFEFRTFWWHGEPVGFGRYWWYGRRYEADEVERRDALRVAAEAARRVDVPFLVVDVAQRTDGRWIVIECNDGQESGYAGVSPIGLWQAIVEAEKRRR